MQKIASIGCPACDDSFYSVVCEKCNELLARKYTYGFGRRVAWFTCEPCRYVICIPNLRLCQCKEMC